MVPLGYSIPYSARSHSLLSRPAQRAASLPDAVAKVFHLAVAIETAEAPENGVPIASYRPGIPVTIRPSWRCSRCHGRSSRRPDRVPPASRGVLMSLFIRASMASVNRPAGRRRCLLCAQPSAGVSTAACPAQGPRRPRFASRAGTGPGPSTTPVRLITFSLHIICTHSPSFLHPHELHFSRSGPG